MNIEKKLRRAFRRATPNVIGTQTTSAPKKRRKLSLEFISIAASFAILISAVGGGFLYFRDYFSGQGAHSGSSGTSGEQPNTAPDPNLGWDTPEPNETEGVMISEERAREIALEYAQGGSMGACKVVSCELVDNAYYKVGISGEIMMWFSEVYVDAYTGEILADPVISEEKAQAIATKYATQLYGDCVVVSCEFIFRSGLDSYYQVGISGAVAEWYTSICVDAFTGEIIDRTIPADLIPEEEAKKIALAKAEETYDNCLVYDCELVDNAYYRVSISSAHPYPSYYPEDNISFRGIVYFVNAATGEFLDTIDAVGSAMDEEDARKIASVQAEALYDSFLITNCEFNFRSGLHSFYDFTILADTNNGTEEVHFVVEDWLTYPSVEESVTPPIDAPLTMTGARDVALGMWDHYVDYIHCLKISENSDFYTVYYEQGEYAYESHIDFDGNVLYDGGATHIGLRADQQMGHLIGWEKARSIALNACGRDVSELIGFTYEYCPSDPDYYHLELYFEDDGFTYRIGALNGELLEGPTVEITPPDGAIDIEKATQIAMEYTGHTEDYAAGNVTDLACKFDEENSTYYVYFRANYKSYAIGIHAYTGEVLICDYWIYGDPPQDGMISVEMALCLAVDYTGHGAYYTQGDLDDMACTLDESGASPVYYVYYRMLDKEYTVAVDAYTGEILSCNGQGTDTPAFYSEDDAIQAALGYSNLTKEQYAYIECIRLGNEFNRSVYLVIFDKYLYTIVDANTLQVMDSRRQFPTDTIDAETATVQALSLIGVDTWDRRVLTMRGVFNDGSPFYCAEFYDGNTMYVCLIDAYSTEILYSVTKEAILGNYVDVSMYAALNHVGLSVEDVTDLSYEHDTTTDPDIPRNRIFFTANGVRYEIVVGAHVSNHLEILEVLTTNIG